METAKSKGVKIHLPTDFVCGSKFSNDAETCVATVKDGIRAGYMVSLLHVYLWCELRKKKRRGEGRASSETSYNVW